MKLSQLQTGDKGVIVKVSGRGAFRRRITEMGFIRGKEVEVLQNAPLNDPILYRILGYEVSLRRGDANLVEVLPVGDELKPAKRVIYRSEHELMMPDKDVTTIAHEISKTIRVAFVGNPNSGKTSLFNFASGAHERVGNYSGVTVDAKEAVFRQSGYKFKIVDLPGTYSLSTYSPEELYVRKHLSEETPDVVVNVVDASNLERNLYLTCQLIDMSLPTVMALNMFDCLEKSGDKFDYEMLGGMIGIPIIPTNGRTNEGLKPLFDRVIKVYEGSDPLVRRVRINYGETLENAISHVRDVIKQSDDIEMNISKRFLAIKLLEKDEDIETYITEKADSEEILKVSDRQRLHAEGLLKVDSETAFADARYGFIAGALQQTFEPNKIKEVSRTTIIDTFVIHKFFGFPIFLFFLWVMFEATFRLGEYPKGWIEFAVGEFGDLVEGLMSDGPLKDLLVGGIIGGVGEVIVFLPNILILYFFISLMEDSGYMARATFIMDKVMHKMGLHGKSFIPLIMGFGCNVPAIMATRTIESRNSRILTMLINPLFSCSARLPVYLLLAGMFFPDHAGTILFILYTSGILLAVLMARLLKRFFFKHEDVPFVMELPPYRTPTWRSIIVHMWGKGSQYLRKMGGVILVASIIIWFLSYYPRETGRTAAFDQQLADIEQSDRADEEKEELLDEVNRLKNIDLQENSYIGRVGRTIQPVLAPLGFDWRISVSILSGMAAKEIVISTLAVLYTGDDEDEELLSERMQQSVDAEGRPAFTPLIALSLMFFVLIYFPCVATIAAINKESGSWKWAAFVVVYSCVLAWIVSFLVYQIGTIIVG